MAKSSSTLNQVVRTCVHHYCILGPIEGVYIVLQAATVWPALRIALTLLPPRNCDFSPLTCVFHFSPSSSSLPSPSSYSSSFFGGGMLGMEYKDTIYHQTTLLASSFHFIGPL